MVSERITLRYPKSKVDKPIISKLVREYNLDFNIMKASITPNEKGLMVLDISGSKEDVEKGISFLKKIGVDVSSTEHDVTWDSQRCTSCGACIGFCPTEALWVDRKTMKVSFDSEKCIICELCLHYCPTRAMRINFDKYM